MREFETSRLHRRFATARDFDHMHEIARHLIHSTEMLTTALSVVECMIYECEFTGGGSDSQASSACRGEVHFISSLMKALLHRSSALKNGWKTRLRWSMSRHTRSQSTRYEVWLSETQALHANAQHDTSIVSQITLTSRRAGHTTKGISILGMLFFPRTCISVRLLCQTTR